MGMADATAESGAAEAPERLEARDDHHCFGCGRLNPQGLGLTFYRTGEGEGVWAPFTPAQVHEGFPGMAHGGIISALLDEAMAWAISSRGIWAVTGTMTVAYRKPVATGVPIRASGRLVEDRGRKLLLAAELLREADGLLLAEATATFVRVPEERAQAWQERYLGAEAR